MLLIIQKRATNEDLKKMSEDYDKYIKVVIDIEQGILAGGGKRHFEGEQRLLAVGSKQQNLWGGGVDLKTNEVDYNSVINLRPAQDNPSRDIMSAEIRKKFDKIIKDLIL